ncbi:hypothetical protein [Rhizobium sp. NFR07]|uniref:hypothetical protein n=1 Tax=Rhizobium sp. NFR07 TaxID=1566262 RepID=UPI00116048A2|nr:hypothetical protein [Rhizobium sp. NFR07]
MSVISGMTITRQTLRYQAAASRVYADAWTVLDIFTGLPIVVGGIIMDGPSDQQVNELVDELNHEDLETRGKLRPGP